MNERFCAWNIPFTNLENMRLRHLPIYEGRKDKKHLGCYAFFQSDNEGEFAVPSKVPFMKGSNGAVFNAHQWFYRDGNKYYRSLVAKRMPAKLQSLKECAYQLYAFEKSPETVPMIHSIFRTKNHIWVFMRDLRHLTNGATESKTVHHWLLDCEKVLSRGNIMKEIFRIVRLVLETIANLNVEKSFQHGDLHTGNIIVQSSASSIKEVFVIDYGYSLVDGAVAGSPYWKKQKSGTDCAIFFYSLLKHSKAIHKHAPGLEDWIKSKIGPLLESKNYTNLYELLDKMSKEELGHLDIGVIKREFDYAFPK